MATLIKVLSPSEILGFDQPPEMNFEQRRTKFYLTASLKRKLTSLHKPVTKVGLVLQYGYYKCSRKFFKLSTFQPKDIKFICSQLEIDESTIDISDYKFVLKEHTAIVLQLFGHFPFLASEPKFTLEMKHLISKRIGPRKVFVQCTQWLRENKTEIPSYNTLSTIITRELNDFEKILLKK